MSRERFECEELLLFFVLCNNKLNILVRISLLGDNLQEILCCSSLFRDRSAFFLVLSSHPWWVEILGESSWYWCLESGSGSVLVLVLSLWKLVPALWNEDIFVKRGNFGRDSVLQGGLDVTERMMSLSVCVSACGNKRPDTVSSLLDMTSVPRKAL